MTWGSHQLRVEIRKLPSWRVAGLLSCTPSMVGSYADAKQLTTWLPCVSKASSAGISSLLTLIKWSSGARDSTGKDHCSSIDSNPHG
eukprot:2599631-Amphidinium_carterae.2